MKNNQQETFVEHIISKYFWVIVVVVMIMLLWTPDVEAIGTFIYNVLY